jgi:hypothetical protein
MIFIDHTQKKIQRISRAKGGIWNLYKIMLFYSSKRLTVTIAAVYKAA